MFLLIDFTKTATSNTQAYQYLLFQQAIIVFFSLKMCSLIIKMITSPSCVSTLSPHSRDQESISIYLSNLLSAGVLIYCCYHRHLLQMPIQLWETLKDLMPHYPKSLKRQSLIRQFQINTIIMWPTKIQCLQQTPTVKVGQIYLSNYGNKRLSELNLPICLVSY